MVSKKGKLSKKEKLSRKIIKEGKIFILGICLCLNAAAFTACSKKEIEYITEETQNSDGEAQTSSEQGIPEHIEETFGSENGTITVDADVLNIENFGKLPAVEVVIKDWSEQDIQNYAETVFDKGSVEYVLPFRCWSLNALRDEEIEVKSQLEELGLTEETAWASPEYESLAWKLQDLQYAIQTYDESRVLENDGSFQWISAEEGRMTCQAKGTIGGQEYAMCASKGGEYLNDSLGFFQINGEHYAEQDRSIYTFSGTTWLSPDSPLYSNNQCELSEQEAVNQVQDFISQMGISDMAVSGVYQALRYENKIDENGDMYNERGTNGYYVYFGRALQGCTTPPIRDYASDYCYDIQKIEQEGGGIEYSESDRHYGYEFIAALVTDNGIEELRYDHPMEVSEELTEQSKVMEFGKIYEIAEEYFKSQMIGCEIYAIRLCLGRVKYEDSYALLPVWSFEYNDFIDSIEWYPQALMVNAIDGSLIDTQSGRPMALGETKFY